MKTHLSLLSLALVALSIGSAAPRASAQTIITSVPYTISTPGHYALSGNLNSTAANTPAITISANNVILDLSGYYVAGPYNTASMGSSNSTILVGEVANVTIRNGLVAGDAYGIYFSATNAADSRNYVIDTVTVTNCYLAGIYFGGAAAPGSLVKTCNFSRIGNSTMSGTTNPSAIFTLGGIRMENNNIGGVTATNGGTSYGINGDSADFAIGNTISNCGVGIDFVSKYLNNLTYNVTTPFENGGAATGNN